MSHYQRTAVPSTAPFDQWHLPSQPAVAACSTLLQRLPEFIDILADCVQPTVNLRRWNVDTLHTAIQWAAAIETYATNIDSPVQRQQVNEKLEFLVCDKHFHDGFRFSFDELATSRSIMVEHLMRHPYISPSLMQIVIADYAEFHTANHWRRDAAHKLTPVIQSIVKHQLLSTSHRSEDIDCVSLVTAKTVARRTRVRVRQELKASIAMPRSLETLVSYARHSDECLESLCWCLLLQDSTDYRAQLSNLSTSELLRSIEQSSKNDAVLHSYVRGALRLFEPQLFDRARPSTLAMLALVSSFNEDSSGSGNMAERYIQHLMQQLLSAIEQMERTDHLFSPAAQSTADLGATRTATVCTDRSFKSTPMLADDDAFDLPMIQSSNSRATGSPSSSAALAVPITVDPVAVALQLGRLLVCIRELLHSNRHRRHIETHANTTVADLSSYCRNSLEELQSTTLKRGPGGRSVAVWAAFCAVVE